MAYDDFEIERPRGDTLKLTFGIENEGQPVDITGCSFWFTGKRLLANLDGSAVIASTTANGQITITNAAQGKILVKVPATATNALVSKTKLFCDLRMKDSAGDISTPASGMITITLDTTRATT